MTTLLLLNVHVAIVIGFMYVFGASLSKPHIDEFAVEFLYIYIYIYIVRHAVSHFRLLFCEFLCHAYAHCIKCLNITIYLFFVLALEC